jgi:hypothetical protein
MIASRARKSSVVSSLCEAAPDSLPPSPSPHPRRRGAHSGSPAISPP